MVCGLQSRQCLLHRSGSDPWDFSPSLVCAHCCFKGFLCCASPLLPVFLTQGVSQQILRLDKIPNSRCLIKIKTTTKKNPPQHCRAEFSGTAAADTRAVPAPSCPAAYVWPTQGGRERDTTGRLLLPRQEAQIWNLSRQGGEKTSAEFLGSQPHATFLAVPSGGWCSDGI